MLFIKKELSESHIPLMKREEFSFEEARFLDLKQENSYDNLFKHENNSVDLFLKEINNDNSIDHQDESDGQPTQLKENAVTIAPYISPTKPLNLKNPSKTNLNEELLASETEDSQQQIMQDIPMNPNKVEKANNMPPSAMKLSSHLIGPRDVHETPKKLKDSPSRKAVFIDASPPKMIEYERESSEDDEEEESLNDDAAIENQVKPKWKPLSPKKHRPLPTLQPASADSSIMISPLLLLLLKPVHYYEEDTVQPEKLDLTTEELASIKKMTMEEKLNAVLDSQTQKIDFDHDRYLEDAKFNRTKSVVKRTSYYDDMLLNPVKSKQQPKEDFDGLADLYETNIRNTQSEKSLKLDLNRSNSVQSQFSIASGERILETSPVKSDRIVSSSVTMRDGIKGFDDETMEELIQHPKLESHLADFSEASSSFDIFDDTVEKKDVVEQQPITHPATPVKVSHSRQSSLTDALSPYKVGQFLVSVGSNLKKIVSSQNLRDELEMLDAQELNLDNSEKSIEKDTNDNEKVPLNDTVNDEQLQHTEDSFGKETTEEEFESAHTREIEDELLPDDDNAIGNSTELVDDSSATLEGSGSSLMEISKHEYQLQSYPEFDDDPHSFSLDLDGKQNLSQDSIVIGHSKKITSSNVSSCASPQTDVLSIWQSQPEFQHVPRHQTTRCSSITSSNNSIRRKDIHFKINNRNTVHVVSKRVVSRDYEMDESDDILPNISGDSDFGSDFKKMGIKIDEEDEGDEKEEEEKFHDSQTVIAPQSPNRQNVQNIWRTGTIRGGDDYVKPLLKPIDVFSDEEHEVKNVRSTVQVNQPLKGHHPHGESVEIENMQGTEFDDDFYNDTSYTAIKTIDNKEVSMLANLSEFDTTPARPLGVLSQSRINSLPQQLPQPALKTTTTTPAVVKLVNGERGRLFLRLNRLSNLELPDYRSRDAKFCVILDNGIHRVQTDYFKLDDRIPMDKEFELICQESVSIVLTLKAKYDHPTDTLVEVKQREIVKSKSFFGKLFGSKHVITRTKFVNKPAPHDQWKDIMANDGSFGKVIIDLQKFEDSIIGKPKNFELPLINEWNGKNYNQFYKIGKLNVEMLFLPRVSKFEVFPTSIKQAIDELKQLQDQKSIKHEGYLFQEGGDCKFMKRRFFKLQDSTLIAYNEDNLKTRCKINLTKVVEIIYMTTDEVKSDRNFSDNLLTNSFKLRFANNEIIEFNAQDKFEKIEWIEILQDVISKNHFARQPWVKLMHQKEQETV